MNYIHVHSRYGFTLIEMMVVITILAILSLTTYLPYAHHQKKVLLQQATKEIAQSLTEARNLAINGIQTDTGNLNLGVYFGPKAREIVYYTTNFTETFDIQNILANAEVYKTKTLPVGIEIQDISLTGDEILFTFEAISGDLGLQTASGIETTLPNTVDFVVSYRGATSSILQKNIVYYTQSYISDY